jgi:hypothetical protein
MPLDVVRGTAGVIKLESHAFETLRGQKQLDTSASPPNDHNLNPIAERAIRTIDEVATAMFTFSSASVGFWGQQHLAWRC